MKRVQSVVDLVGHTPLIRLQLPEKINPKIRAFAKLEFLNPGGSVKDRPALNMIMRASEKYNLKEREILDSSSGNTAIALALMGRALGFKVTLVMPANVTQSRKDLIRLLGARIILSDPMEGSDGAILLARKLAKEESERYLYLDQYSNPANPEAHYNGTAVEILEELKGEITHFVACIGTGGTIMGTGRRLKEYNKDIKVIAVEPAESLHGLEGMKHMATSIVPKIYHEDELDSKLQITTEIGWDYADRLAKEEGIFAGHSSGAAYAAVCRIAKEIEEGTIVTIFPDRGVRYLFH